MKHLFSALLGLSLLLIVACGSDDEDGQQQIVNEITIGDETFSLTGAALIDFGERSEAYEVAIALSDQLVGVSGGTFSFRSNASLRLLFNLAAADAQRLEPGTYSLGDVLNAGEGRVFLNPFLQVNGSQVPISDGTITVTGAIPNLTVNFDLDLGNGENLQGSFSGTFSVE